MGTPEQLVLVLSEHAMGDDPIWYEPNGELRSFRHLWYRAERVVKYVQEAMGRDTVFTELCRIDGGNGRGGRLTRRWSDLASGRQVHVGAAFVDDLFSALGLLSFSVALGPPDVASRCAPGSNPHVSQTCSRGHEWTPENTRLSGRGARYCATCKSDRERERKGRARRVMEVA